MLQYIFLHDCKAHQMPEMIKQKALQLEPVLGSYGACKFSHIFSVEKPFNYNPLKLLSEHMFMTCMYSNHPPIQNKHRIISVLMPC